MDISRFNIADDWRSIAIQDIAGKSCAFNSDGNTIIEWLTPDIPQPSEEDINAKVAEYKAEWIAKEYARNRKTEYDKLNQLEMQFDDWDAWKAAINEIKAKYPKPE